MPKRPAWNWKMPRRVSAVSSVAVSGTCQPREKFPSQVCLTVSESSTMSLQTT